MAALEAEVRGGRLSREAVRAFRSGLLRHRLLRPGH